MSGEWLQKLQSFLNTLLKPIIKDQKDRNRYIDGKAMLIWAQAFTHETASPDNNYEDLEFMGDAILKAVFPKYLRRRLPYLHKGEYTELNVAYMSKIMQAQLSRQMGLTEYIRVKGIDRAILNLETDVFESFFGALDTISDSLTEGLGFSNCYNMIVHIFQNVEIDETKGRGSAKTQVIQMFVRFDLPKPKEQSPGSEVSVYAISSLSELLNAMGISNPLLGHAIAANDGDAEYSAYKQLVDTFIEAGLITVEREKINSQGRRNIDFTVSLRKEHIDFLQRYGVKIDNPVIGYAEAATKKEAEFEAYTQAFNVLAQYGITTEWAEEAKRNFDLSNEFVAPFVPAAEERLKREGFQSMYFFIPRKTVTTKGAVVQLIGIHPNGQQEILSLTYTSDRSESYRMAKATVVQQYALGQNIGD